MTGRRDVTGREEYVVADDGARLWTWTTGSGPPMALAHGGPGWWNQLEPVAEMVGDLVTSHLWDQRGAGRSSAGGPFSMERVIADMDAVRAHFGHDQWIVAGHSWGCTVALQYALRHPERVRAAILMSGTGIEWARWRARYHADFDARLTPAELVRRSELEALEDRTAEQVVELEFLGLISNLGERDPARLRALARELVDVRYPVNYDANRELNAETKTWDHVELAERCRGLAMPVLVVQGEHDPRPAAASHSLLDVLPDARLEILPGVGHLPWAERPELLRAVLRDFLLRLA